MSGRLPTLVPCDFDLERIAERARQRFELAKAALTGLLADPYKPARHEVAASAVKAADAVLAELDRTAGPTSVSVPPSPATRPGEVE